ncbi:uncharacterized protein BDV14DRAFT_106665 [Aspergillus stella-maris]|uniref:uncharacterized protein n=1 Tax=Aspergillus stella-maris TaxID=1810926 RepID=UPI003CCCF929
MPPSVASGVWTLVISRGRFSHRRKRPSALPEFGTKADTLMQDNVLSCVISGTLLVALLLQPRICSLLLPLFVYQKGELRRQGVSEISWEPEAVAQDPIDIVYPCLSSLAHTWLCPFFSPGMRAK